MHNACGKGVYNVRIVAGKSCQLLSTVWVYARHAANSLCVNPLFFRTSFPYFPLSLSTANFANSPPLIHSFTHNPQHLLLLPLNKN